MSNFNLERVTNDVSTPTAVVNILRQSVDLQTEQIANSRLTSKELADIEQLFIDIGHEVSKNLSKEPDASLMDGWLAQELHIALTEVRVKSPWILNDAAFWHWLSFDVFSEYSVARWCGGTTWLSNRDLPQPPDSGLMRMTVSATSVKTHNRHALRRLYIYADCSFSYDGTYDHLPLMLNSDLDIASAVFERRLGIINKFAVLLCKEAVKLVKSATMSARDRRRKFFREVNLLLATVSPEFLDESEQLVYLQDIIKEIP